MRKRNLRNTINVETEIGNLFLVRFVLLCVFLRQIFKYLFSFEKLLIIFEKKLNEKKNLINGSNFSECRVGASAMSALVFSYLFLIN